MGDEIIKETAPTNLNKNKANCKMQNFYILLAFSLITVSIYCYLIKYQGKQNHLFSFHLISNKVKEIIYQKYK